MSKEILVYGSLREGQYNFKRFKDFYGDDIKYIETIPRITNYKMYDLGSYPCIVYSTNMHDAITVDKLQVSDACYEMIYSMEIGAGYTLSEMGRLEGGVVNRYGIFTMENAPRNATHVVNGDWTKYLKQVKVV